MSDRNVNTMALAKMAQGRTLVAQTAVMSVVDSNERALTLMSRCVLAMCKLPYASDPLQLEYATQILAAEVRLLEETEPDSDCVHKAKDSFLQMYNGAVNRLANTMTAEAQRSVWHGALAQYPDNLRHRVASSAYLTSGAIINWWFRIACDSSLLPPLEESIGNPSPVDPIQPSINTHSRAAGKGQEVATPKSPGAPPSNLPAAPHKGSCSHRLSVNPQCQGKVELVGSSMGGSATLAEETGPEESTDVAMGDNSDLPANSPILQLSGNVLLLPDEQSDSTVALKAHLPHSANMLPTLRGERRNNGSSADVNEGARQSLDSHPQVFIRGQAKRSRKRKTHEISDAPSPDKDKSRTKRQKPSARTTATTSVDDNEHEAGPNKPAGADARVTSARRIIFTSERERKRAIKVATKYMKGLETLQLELYRGLLQIITDRVGKEEANRILDAAKDDARARRAEEAGQGNRVPPAPTAEWDFIASLCGGSEADVASRRLGAHALPAAEVPLRHEGNVTVDTNTKISDTNTPAGGVNAQSTA